MPHGDKAIGVKAEDAQEFPKDLTIPKLFHQQAKRYGKDRVAMREKEFGIWRPITWQDYLDNVKYIALGLIKLGLQEGDKVAMIGDNRPEGLMAEMAALCARGVGVWLFQDCLMDEVRYIIDHSDAKFVFGEGQEEVDKVLSILKDCPKLKKIIWDDPKGLRQYHQDCLISLRDVQELGRELEKEKPHLFEELIHKGHGEEIALLFYTSGTTALPKGALLSHHNMLSMGKHLMEVDPCKDSDDYVSYLPFAWIGEQMMSISCGLQMGYTLNFPEAPETAQANIREIGRRHVCPAPHVRADDPHRPGQISGCHRLKRFTGSPRVGYRVADMKYKTGALYWQALHGLVYATVQKKLKDNLG
jgi:long-chain acyl-CoA synthetase